MKRKWLNSFTVGLFWTLVALAFYRYDLNRTLPLFLPLELKSFDLKVRARGERPVSGQIVIVAIDEKSLLKEGRWPWPRTLMANLVDRLTESGAATIGFDILFPEKDAYVPFATLNEELRKKDLAGLDSEALIKWMGEVGDSDRLFAESIERSLRTVLAYFVYPTKKEAGGFAKKLSSKDLELLDFSQYSIIQRFDSPENPIPLKSIYAVGMSLHELMFAANSGGFVSYLPDIDGVIRQVPLVMQHEEYLFPPLSLQLLREASKLPLGIIIEPLGVDRIRLGDNMIPASEEGQLWVNYYGPAHTFTHYSATDVLSGKIGADKLNGKIVLVGGTATAIHDLHTTPFGSLFPGVEVHANVMEGIINKDFLERPDRVVLLDWLIVLCSGLLIGFGSLFFQAYTMALFVVLEVLGFLGVDYFLFSQMGIVINSVFPVVALIFIYSGITVYRLAFEAREKRFIRGAFSQYLSPAVIERLVADPSLLKLGGEEKELTAFFSDVAGFSSISEKLTPDELVDLLNEYLTEMTDIILKYEGTVDKFEGDAIIAFFGAPIPFEDHARRACWVSIEMQLRLAELREQWREEGRDELFMRIGLNTGLMKIGNMGSKTRMDYTMMGDSVNLAARLEGVNKAYKTSSMISEFTYQEAKEGIEVRELDLVRVVGKSEPIRIYELLGKKGEMDDRIGEILPIYYHGLDAYRRHQWDEGIKFFQKVLAIHEKDGPSLTFLDRCIQYKEAPPAEDWDGVFGMTSK